MRWQHQTRSSDRILSALCANTIEACKPFVWMIWRYHDIVRWFGDLNQTTAYSPYGHNKKKHPCHSHELTFCYFAWFEEFQQWYLVSLPTGTSCPHSDCAGMSLMDQQVFTVPRQSGEHFHWDLWPLLWLPLGWCHNTQLHVKAYSAGFRLSSR